MVNLEKWGIVFFPTLSGLKKWRKVCKNMAPIFLVKLGILRKDFIVNMKNGLRLNVIYEGKDDSTSMLKDVYVNNPYDIDRIDKKNVSVAVDIGANQGYVSTLIALKIKNAKIYSYEPAKRTFDSLVKNIKLNNFEKRIFPFNYVVSKKKGDIKFFLNKANAGHSIVEGMVNDNLKKGEYEILQSVRIDDIFKNNKLQKIDVLKIDCEGAEYEIFFNLPKKYLSKIRHLFMELHDTKEHHPEELKKFLEKNGFRVFSSDAPEIYAFNEKFKE